MKTTMIIPAKGFSRRIPQKNLQPFCGLPLVEWAVILGVCSKLVDEVWVSTENKLIADVCERRGAHIKWREYEDTHETTGGVPIQECADYLGEKGQLENGDIVVVHLCTYPVLQPFDIDRLIMALLSFTDLTDREVGQVSYQVPRRTMIVNKKIAPGQTAGITTMGLNDYSILTNAGSCTSAGWANNFLGGKAKPGSFIPLKPWQDHDVDTYEEWEFAELAMEHYILKGKGEQVYYDYGRTGTDKVKKTKRSV